MKFIKLTDVSNMEVLVNVDRISIIHEAINNTDNEGITEVFLAGNNDDVLCVKESFSEIKNKIGVQNIT